MPDLTQTYETDAGAPITIEDVLVNDAEAALQSQIAEITSSVDYGIVIKALPDDVLLTRIGDATIAELLTKKEFLDQAITWLSDNPTFGVDMDLINLFKTVANDTPLAISIATSELQGLDDLQSMLRDLYANSEQFSISGSASINAREPNAPLAVWVALHPDLTLEELGVYAKDFLSGKYNSPLVAKPNEKQIVWISKLSTLLNNTRSFGYGKYNVAEFAQMADQMDLVFQAAQLYGPAILKAITSAFNKNAGDDEAAMLSFFSSFVKIMPAFKDTYNLIVDHSITINDMLQVMLLGFSTTKVDRLKDVYLGEGGYYERTTPLVIIGEIITAVLQTDPMATGYVNELVKAWPLKSSDGIAFFPTMSGFYYYEPGAVGNNLHYVENRWDGDVNVFLKVASTIAKTPIPFAKIVNSLLQLGFNASSFSSSVAYARSTKLGSQVSSYSKLFDLGVEYAKTHVMQVIQEKVVPAIMQTVNSVTNPPVKEFVVRDQHVPVTTLVPGDAVAPYGQPEIQDVSGLDGIQHQPERLRRLKYD